MALLRKIPRIDISRLDVETLEIVVLPASSDSQAGPPSLPQPVDLPFSVHIASLHLGSITLLESELNRREIGEISGRLNADAHSLHLVGRATTPWGTGNADLQLGLSEPFHLEGHIDADILAEGVRLEVAAEPSGTLSHVQLKGTARAFQNQARFDIHLAPFSDRPIAAGRILVATVDLRRFDPRLPDALIDAELLFQPSRIDDAAARLLLQNHRSGTLDADRIPLESLDISVRVRPDRIEAGHIDLRLAGGATLSSGSDANDGGQGGFWMQISGKPKDAHRFELELQANGIDLHSFHTKLLSTRLNGPIRFFGTPEHQQLKARLAQKDWMAAIEAVRQGSRIEIKPFRLLADRTLPIVLLTGHIDMKDAMPFRIDARLNRFDPSRFGTYPQADLQLNVQATGEARTYQSRFDIQISPSTWQGHTVSGNLHGSLTPKGIDGLQTTLRLGPNSLNAQGDLGREGLFLNWRLDVPALNALDSSFSGELRAQGQIGGTLQHPSGRFDLHATHLVLPEHVRIARIAAQGTLQQGLSGELALHVHAQQVRLGSDNLSDTRLNAFGRLDSHRIELSLSNGKHDLQTMLAGGYRTQDGWRGYIETLRIEGRPSLRLSAPAGLHITGLGAFLSDIHLQSTFGMLDVQEIRWEPPSREASPIRFASTGSFRDIDLTQFLDLLGFDTSTVAGSTLRMDMTWNIDVGEHLFGTVVIERRSGDLYLAGNPPLPLDLSTLTLHLQAREDRLSARLEADSATLGSIRSQLRTRMASIGFDWGIKTSTPIEGDIDADIFSIAWIGRMAGPWLNIDGRFLANVRLSGSVNAPMLSGQISGSGLRVALPELGIDIHDGTLDASLADHTLRIHRLVMKETTGELLANGTIQLQDRTIQGDMHLEARHLTVLHRPDRHAIVTGNGNVTVHEKGIRIETRLAIDEANIELPQGTEPKLSEDVVVVGRSDQPLPVQADSAYAVAAIVQIDLADKVHVSGYGLDARLGGSFSLQAATGKPLSAEGSIEVNQGSYSAYGQKLRLVKGGKVNFSGPVDNPGLNFSAQRDNLPVQVGVLVGGTLQKPLVTLTSTPAMSDAETLSWLVLGQDITSADANGMALLQTAASALLSSGQRVPITQRIATHLGLDTLELRGQSGLQSGVVTIGKRITSRLSVSVEQALGSTESVFQIRYNITPRFSVRLQSGSDNALDAFYTFRFH